MERFTCLKSKLKKNIDRFFAFGNMIKAYFTLAIGFNYLYLAN
ncbi:hypothetical protein SpAn4DRAFT_5125 [Sporomusa ovata]|uniref:Uncharacterized protein n=1 Tax=Sporomusa ovata TaxID=2378 RepID=A0A0U1L3H7_9FIRM|nr:hypothetical protein SpAn4DRAFT_5125 [Sporomusa ovata]